MPQPTLIVTTCGTSILTNDAAPEVRSLLFRHANAASLDSLGGDDRAAVEAWVAARIQTVSGWDVPTARKGSAELNALETWLTQHPQAERVEHIIVATATWMGQQTAQAVAGYLQARGQVATVQVMQDLQTADVASMQLGLSDVVVWADQTLPGYRASGYQIAFNLTGGFKGISGFFQLVGMLYADEVFFLFESSKEVMSIPRLPLAMQAGEAVRAHVQALRRLARGLPVEAALLGGVPDAWWMRVDDQVAFSALGQLVWNQVRQDVYAAGLLPPPSSLIRYGEGFARSVDRVCAKRAERYRLVNERIDDLMVQRETGKAVHRLDLKALQGKHAQVTHEIDAWADQDVRRIFCRFEADVVVLVELGEHL